MSNGNHVVGNTSRHHEQPFLYTWNRRLRHLHGISLRNLDVTPPASRSRGKTITDDEYNLKTVAKALAQDERKTLHHARSFDDVSKANESSPRPVQKSVTAYQKNDIPAKRPGGRRRRSTLHWAASNPRSRQLKLEAVEENRMVDSFFSVHHEELKEPLYISEIMEKSMNPSFSFFDLDSSVTQICRSDWFILRVWAKVNSAEDFRLLVELRINLRSLQFIGKSLETFHHPLPENCILIHLSDGIYTSFTDLPSEDYSQPGLTAAMTAMQEANTASFDTLMQLANLEDCIEDALQTRKKLETEISALLEETRKAGPTHSELAARKGTMKATQAAMDSERVRIDAIRKTKGELNSSQHERRNMLKQPPAPGHVESDEVKTGSQKLQKDIDDLIETAQGQIRRIGAGLLQIFPIEPIKNKPLQFTIRNIHLPNSTFDDTNRDEIAAALGYTAQLVHQLSLYLSVPLPYAVEPNGSTSLIHDNVSVGLSQRRYPLHPTSVNYKFEYGVFLLNKDIEFLMNRTGVRVLDIRHTLPNLKYLLYILTSGTGDLPARKAGGIRGLLGARGTPSISRRGSEDSVQSQGELFGPAAAAMRNGSKTSPTEEKGMSDEAFNSGPTRANGLPYRRSMLRDAG